jgi:hypothetical protein
MIVAVAMLMIIIQKGLRQGRLLLLRMKEGSGVRASSRLLPMGKCLWPPGNAAPDPQVSVFVGVLERASFAVFSFPSSLHVHQEEQPFAHEARRTGPET